MTVLPYDALSVTLGEPAEAVVMINVLSALEPDYRKRLWPVLATALELAGTVPATCTGSQTQGAEGLLAWRRG